MLFLWNCKNLWLSALRGLTRLQPFEIISMLLCLLANLNHLQTSIQPTTVPQCVYAPLLKSYYQLGYQFHFIQPITGHLKFPIIILKTSFIFMFYILKQIPIFIRFLGDCCNTVLSWGSRNVLWIEKLHYYSFNVSWRYGWWSLYILG